MAEDNKEYNAGEVDPERPFPGLLSFEEKNELQFGGRDVEINELFLLVKRNSPTIVFGKSGIGKTSLLQAGLMPQLQRSGFYPMYFRIDYASVKSPLSQLKDFVSEKFKTVDPTDPGIGSRTLWEYFHDVNLPGGGLTPVLILDQFEETFTIGKDKNSELITELSDLAENRVPYTVHEEYQERDELIPSHYEKLTYRVIISLREDYLAQLEDLKKYLPSLNKSRYRIVQMTGNQAMDAVLKSANGLIDKEVAKAIIKKLPDITERNFDELAHDNDKVKKQLVEPFLLSLICYQINEKRIERKINKFTEALVSDFKIEDVIQSFYNDSLKDLGDNVSEGIEDTLLTDSGYRKLESLEQLQTNYKIGHNIIAALINKRIIRQEERDGVEYVELIHDVLIPVIKERHDKRIAEKNELEKKQKEEAQKLALDAEIQKKNLKRTKRINVIVLALALVALGLFAWALRADHEAKNSATQANIEKEKAQKETDSAKTQKGIADSLKNDAIKKSTDIKKAFDQQTEELDKFIKTIGLDKIPEPQLNILKNIYKINNNLGSIEGYEVKPLIYIQYDDIKLKLKMKYLQDSLRKLGYSVPGIQIIFPIDTTELRYFDSTDINKAKAIEVLGKIKSFGWDAKLQYVKGYNIRQYQFELWVKSK